MDLKNQIDNWKQKRFLFNILEFRDFDICEIYHDIKDYSRLTKLMEKKWWELYEQKYIEWYESDILFMQTWYEFYFKLVYHKQHFKEEKEAERLNILKRRETFLIYNNQIWQ